MVSLKNLFTWGLKDPQFRISPAHGLPRTWRFYADPGFWLASVLLIAIFGFLNLWPFLSTMVANAAAGSDIWLIAALIGLFAFHPLLCYWVVWDSYRWNFPNRMIYVFLVCFTDVLVLIVYLFARADWVMEAQRQARMHKLGLKDE